MISVGIETDQIDSIKIASYGIAYWGELSATLPVGGIYDELRTFSRQYYQYTSMAVKAKINLGNLLDQTMPGIQNLLSDQNGNHKLTYFVRQYWHFGHVLALGEKRFISAYCSWAKKQGFRMNERKAKEIYTLSQNGIPVFPNTGSTKVLVLETVAPRVIAEIGDIRRFHNKNALIAYTGIDAPPYQSGSFTATKRRISKRGNKYLRKTGYEIMQAVMRTKPSSDDAVYRFILKKQAEGKNSKSAKIAGLNKFLKIYYARVNEVYREIEDQLIFGSEI